MALGVGTGSAAARRAAAAMPQAEQDSLLSSLSRNTGSALEQLGLFLDTPGAITRGVLAGDPMSGFNWDYDKRTSGEELLESYGLLSEDNNPYLRTAASFGAEVLTDPLSWLTLPMSSLNKAGRAAKAAGILDLASSAAQARMGSAARSTLTGSMADNALGKILPMGLGKTAENFAVRPMVGPRVARTTTTLDEVVQAAPDPVEALQKVTTYLNKSGTAYDSVKNQRLGGAFGIGLMSPLVTFTPPGSGKVLDALDAAGQFIGWSYPARLASAWFDERVGGMVDAGDQIAALRQFKSLDSARATGRRLASEHAQTVASIPMSPRAKALLGADSLLSEQGNDFLTRVFENKPTAADRTLMRELPGIHNAVGSWDRLRSNNVAEAKQLGLAYNELKDPRFGVEYSPRSGSELDFQEYGTGFGRSMYQARVDEEMSRNVNLFTPGGTVDLREASKLPVVRQWVQSGQDSPSSVAQVGNEIASFINRKHGYQAIDQAQGEGIARVMQRLNKDLPQDIPIFAGHPLNEQTRVIISQEMARANARHVYDSMAEYAIRSPANQLPGMGYKNLASAAQDIASRVGLKTSSAGLDPAVQQNIVQRVAAKFGIAPDQVDLSQIAIPEAVYNRLSKIQDFYSSPRAQQELSGLFDSLTQVWKSFILAFPARHVRDMYSNAFSVWLETGDPLATRNGYSLAKKVLAGQVDSILPQIAKLPKYQGIADPAALKRQFNADIAASGILTGLSQADVLSARRAGELSRILPGVTPVSRAGAFKEMLPDGSRNPLQMIYDFGVIRGDMPWNNKFETRNPLLNWSQKLSDANDSIARLGGYLALLAKGIDPQVAAERMHKALVNYDSLTSVERGLLRKIFPWWAYTSRIGKYVVQSMAEDPGGLFSQTVRAMNVAGNEGDGTYVPARLRQQLSFRLPDEWLAAVGIDQTPGTQTFLTDIDLPGMDALSLVDPFSVQGTIGNVLAQTNPFIKGTAELAFNEDLFSKRRLADADPAINKVYRRLTSGGELSNVAKVVGSNIPGTQRALGLAAGLMDDRYPMQHKLPKTLLKSLAIMVTDVDDEWRLSDAQRQLNRELEDYTNYFTTSYLDKEKLSAAPADVQRLAVLARIIEQQKRKVAKEKKKGASAKLPPQFAGIPQ